MDRDRLVALVEELHGILPPHPAALDFAADLPGLIAAFRALDPGRFEDEPTDFLLALDAFADDAGR
jgi:hypothetical protein